MARVGRLAALALGGLALGHSQTTQAVGRPALRDPRPRRHRRGRQPVDTLRVHFATAAGQDRAGTDSSGATAPGGNTASGAETLDTSVLIAPSGHTLRWGETYRIYGGGLRIFRDGVGWPVVQPGGRYRLVVRDVQGRDRDPAPAISFEFFTTGVWTGTPDSPGRWMSDGRFVVELHLCHGGGISGRNADLRFDPCGQRSVEDSFTAGDLLLDLMPHVEMVANGVTVGGPAPGRTVALHRDGLLGTVTLEVVDLFVVARQIRVAATGLRQPDGRLVPRRPASRALAST